MSNGVWDVVVPEAATNMVLNPVFGATGNFTIVGGATSAVITNSVTYLGPNALLVGTATDNEGVYLTLSALSNAIYYVTARCQYTVSFKPWDWSLDNITYVTPTQTRQEGDWLVYETQFPAAQANGSTKLYILKNGAPGTLNLIIGHVQVEQKTYDTTPITGDIAGFLTNGYTWSGAAHASTSSRSSQERSGGRVVDMEATYGVKVRWSAGAGMNNLQHLTQTQALLPGAAFLGVKVLPRTLDLVTVMGTSYTPTAIHSVRKAILDVLKIDLVRDAQPVKLRYRGARSTRPLEFNCIYDSGMTFDIGGPQLDMPVIRLIAYDPYAYELGEVSAQLTTLTSTANANYTVKRVDGVWSNISSAFNGTVWAIAQAPDGSYYFCGDFTNVGDANGDGIVKYNPATGTFSSLGTGLTAAGGRALAVMPDGTLYVGGSFTGAGGVANTRGIAKWDGSNWSAVSTGLAAAEFVLKFAVGQDGSLYVGGSFLNLGDANGDNIVKWNGAAWSSLGTGTNLPVNTLVIGQDGSLYAGGAFGSAGGVANTSEIAKWNGSAWSSVSGGISSGQVYALAVGPDGALYIGGSFTDVGDSNGDYVVKWNGQGFVSLGSGMNGNVYSLTVDLDGILYASGAFTNAGGLTISNRTSAWNGYTWSHLAIDLPGTPNVYYLNAIKGTLFLGYDTSGTATNSTVNNINNTGTARSYPVVSIKRSGGTSATVEWLRNETTGRTIYLNYALQSGETLTIDFRLGKRSIVSSFYGVVWRAALRGSEFSDFYLLPGVNAISAYVNQVGGPTMTQNMVWKTTHESADGAAL